MQYTVRRLLVATCFFAFPLALFRGYGIYGVVAAGITGIGLAGLCLVVKTEQIWPTVRMAIIMIGGAIGGLILYSAIKWLSAGV